MRRFGAGRSVAGAFSLAWAVGMAGCGGEETPDTVELGLLAEGADQVMVSVHHFMTREGIRRAAVRADTAYVIDDESTIELRRLRLVFYGDDGAEESVLTAERGSYHLESGNMTAEGSVLVVQSDGTQRLETEQLAYDAAADKIRSQTPFVLTRPDRVIRGNSFVSDPSLENHEVEQFQSVTDVDEQ